MTMRDDRDPAKRPDLLDPGHNDVRDLLRLVGPAVLALGGSEQRGPRSKGGAKGSVRDF